ncbi:carboxymuconolactone decarboxylase family protein [Flavisphingomonas formosensis]|uniref:carboxymuconolactone decarboxylase family protein n=1 Tax=Flavisphingomonas formosensis TaxID=861534 RepID=UPI0012F75980|nr:carboxymuconolactone decarboxylase family protein [Sphingomonas formosensis]
MAGGEPRIPYPDPAQFEGIRRNSAESRLNVERMFAHIPPGLFEGYGAFASSVMSNASLDPVLRELAILRVGHLSHCAYEIYQHESFARYIGMSDTLIAAAAVGAEDPALDARQRAVLAFTDDLVLRIRPTDAVLGEARRQLSIHELFSVLLTVGQYMTVCRILETTGVPIEGDSSIVTGKLSAIPAQAPAAAG